MVEINAEPFKQNTWVWNDLHAAKTLPGRPLQDCLGSAPLAAEQLPPFVLVLPERLKEQMIEHAGRWITHEQAGILLGRAYRDPGGVVYTVLTAAVPVDDTEAGIAQVKLRASSWPSIWKELLQDQEQEIVGWYHSHPGYGIYMSATDQNTQNNYFSAQWQIAVIVDPVRREFGVFAGNNTDPLPDSAVLCI